jgi:hypothetical protein
MREVLPFMGERRSAKIREVIALHEASGQSRRVRHGHGSCAEYKRGCRCEPCRQAKRAEYLARR